ncbi:MAG: 50S ribosomal protein L23 [Planctomycetaceae bacterium]|nr:50S ribosomal protein L23 [Planctomycetaceae bacterium]
MAVLSESGVELLPHQIVLRPLVTEKGTHLSEKLNTYTFKVHMLADKESIRKAVEELWSVRVVDVRTQRRVGKTRRHKMRAGQRSDWKKALVKLHEEDRIAFF